MDKALFKFIIVGDQSVGKSAILKNYTSGRFEDNSTKPTLGFEFVKKIVQCEDKEVELQLWDTCGQEQFRSLTRNFYQKAAVAFLVYDISKKDSLTKLALWVKDVDEQTKSIIKVLVGNKSDLTREVTKEQAKAFMNEHGFLLFFETSARTGENIEEAFKASIDQVLLKMIKSAEYRQQIKSAKQTPSQSRQQSLPNTSREMYDEEVVPQQTKLQNKPQKKSCC